VGAAQSAGGAEIGERRRAERALDRLAFGDGHLLVNRLQEVVDLRLGRRDGRLDAALGCAFLAQMQLPHPAPLDLGELDYRFSILAQIANHLYDDLIDFGTTQSPALEKQHLIRSRGE
jgi:hypothetical protein